ncbi:SURF1 family protein [Algibacillus agarilyticus]|uniref:SURF1 family protein n=1 Tax=Algibacillus agarilyticus TaxID=2234133 RepID=UPI0013001B1B|nr:SURF1 family protein [Algibacillus agarilyticus]
MQITVGAFCQKIQVIPVVIIFLLLCILIKLGWWQLERSIEKESRLLRIEQLVSLGQQDLLHLPLPAELQQDFPVRVKGSFDVRYTWLIENKIVDGQLGFDVIGLFYPQGHLPALVNLGWIAADIQLNPAERVQPPADVISFNAIVHFPEQNPFMSDALIGSTYPKRMHQLSVAKIANELDLILQPFVLLQDDSGFTQFKSHWHPVVMSPEKHQAYAVQWFALAATLFLLTCWRFKQICLKIKK